MDVSIAQIDVSNGNFYKNLDKAKLFIEMAIAQKSDLVLLPEVFTTGFDYKNMKNLSKLTHSALQELSKLSNDIAICGSMLSRKNSDIYNTFYVIYKSNIIFEYSKSMLFPLTNEDRYFKAGDINQKNTFSINNITFGVSICYELRFSEFFRKAAINGASIHLVSAIWPKERIDHWQALLHAKAIENQLFIAGSNAAYSYNAGGYSCIYDPWGKELINLYKKPSLSTIKLNFKVLNNARKRIPSLLASKIFYQNST